ncbi:MAG: hypothetical protein IJ030_05475 [Oscillospiraceae bacterium]|nr:hypothetical protein [Oscillospiraceae bacterium]
MYKYADKLRAFLDQNPVGYAEGDSLLDELHWCYTESNFSDSPELRSRVQQLYSSMPELSEARFDEIFGYINDLTVQQEKLAFQAGVKIGFRLASELLE